MNLYDILTAEKWSPMERYKEDLLSNIEGEGYRLDGKMSPEIFVQIIKDDGQIYEGWTDPVKAKSDIDNFMDGLIYCYRNISDDFEVSAELMVSITGYSYGVFKTKGLMSALKRLEKYIPNAAGVDKEMMNQGIVQIIKVPYQL